MTASTNVVGSGSPDQLPLPTTPYATVGPEGEAGSTVDTSLALESGDAAPVTLQGVRAGAATPRVIGLDLSLTGTGMSDGGTTWLIRSAGKKADDLPSRTARLRKIRAEVITRCEGADLVVVEGPSYGTSSGHMHDRSGLWWLIVQALTHRGISVVEVAPSTLKKYATGKGNGPKGAVIEAAARRFPNVVIGGDDNRADAQWLHAMGVDHLTGQAMVPEAHRVALKAVRWPAAVGVAS